MIAQRVHGQAVNRRRWMLSCVGAVSALGSPTGISWAQQVDAGDVTEAARRANDIVSRYYGRLRALGLVTTPAPRVAIVYLPERTNYDRRRREISAPAWSQAPETLHEQVRVWARQTGGRVSAEALFQEIYQGFMIAHECTHAYQADLGFWRPEADLFESEIIANRGAVAFALEEKIGPLAIEALMNLADEALSRAPSPVPPGADLRGFFNANYAAIQSDPVQHGWFEATMMQIAWRRRGELGFDALMTNLKDASA